MRGWIRFGTVAELLLHLVLDVLEVASRRPTLESRNCFPHAVFYFANTRVTEWDSLDAIKHRAGNGPHSLVWNIIPWTFFVITRQ